MAITHHFMLPSIQKKLLNKPPKATKLRETWKCVEVVYMPCANEDINEIVWADYEK